MFFDNLLKPIIEKSFSYIKDSQNLLQLCDDLEVDNKAYLYSCDFATLYTNIELKDAIVNVCSYLSITYLIKD